MSTPDQRTPADQISGPNWQPRHSDAPAPLLPLGHWTDLSEITPGDLPTQTEFELTRLAGHQEKWRFSLDWSEWSKEIRALRGLPRQLALEVAAQTLAHILPMQQMIHLDQPEDPETGQPEDLRAINGRLATEQWGQWNEDLPELLDRWSIKFMPPLTVERPPELEQGPDQAREWARAAAGLRLLLSEQLRKDPMWVMGLHRAAPQLTITTAPAVASEAPQAPWSAHEQAPEWITPLASPKGQALLWTLGLRPAADVHEGGSLHGTHVDEPLSRLNSVAAGVYDAMEGAWLLQALLEPGTLSFALADACLLPDDPLRGRAANITAGRAKIRAAGPRPSAP